ncbi:tetratricopeptide repeat protein [Nitrospira sp. M1]
MKRLLGILAIAICLMFVGMNASAGMGKKSVPALQAAAESGAAGHNAEGIKHYEKGHWEKAHEHFMEAAKADPKSAEAHYNLALTLDNMGDHKAATQHFQDAYDLGKDNPDIQNSGILKAHLKMK